MERAFRLRVGKQFQKFRTMDIVAQHASRRMRKCIDRLTKGRSHEEAGNRRSYFLDLVWKANQLAQKPAVSVDRDASANLPQHASLFKDCHVESARPQGERGRQAANAAADNGDLKLL